MPEKKTYRTGDQCPNCLSSSAFVELVTSTPKPNIGKRIRRFYCSEKCGWVHKELIPLKEAPKRRKSQRYLRQVIRSTQNE